MLKIAIVAFAAAAAAMLFGYAAAAVFSTDAGRVAAAIALGVALLVLARSRPDRAAHIARAAVANTSPTRIAAIPSAPSEAPRIVSLFR